MVNSSARVMGTWVGLEDELGFSTGTPFMSPSKFFSTYFGDVLLDGTPSPSPFAGARLVTSMDILAATESAETTWLSQLLQLCQAYPNIRFDILCFAASGIYSKNAPLLDPLNQYEWDNLTALVKATSSYPSVYGYQLEYEYVPEWGTQQQQIAAKFISVVEGNGGRVVTAGGALTTWGSRPTLAYRGFPYGSAPDDAEQAIWSYQTSDYGMETGIYNTLDHGFPTPGTLPADPAIPANIPGWNQEIIDAIINDSLMKVPQAHRQVTYPTAGMTSNATPGSSLWNNALFRSWFFTNPNFSQYARSGVGGGIPPPLIPTSLNLRAQVV